MPIDKISSGQLLQEFRDLCMKLGTDRDNTDLLRKCDQYQQEIDRRMAW